MTLYLVGAGLGDEKDLTLRALDTLRDCERVYFEGYTSRYAGSLESLSNMIGKPVKMLLRSELEQSPEENVLAPDGDNALIVVGDPLVATTHTDLVLRAWEAGIKVKVIHNASIYSAVGETGLQPYKFGKTTTIAYPEGDWFPKSPYEAIKENRRMGLHTLCLLDVKADQRRYMSVNEAVKLLFRMEQERFQNIFKEETLCVGAARLGQDAKIAFGQAKRLLEFDFGVPPHVLIVPAKLHFMEEDILKAYKV